MGFPVATALAEDASQLVDRLVNINSGPAGDSCELPLAARLEYLPVIGQTMWRLAPDVLIKNGVSKAFAPGFEVETGFDDPDQVVEDVRAMTYTSFKESHDAYDEFNDVPLDERLRQSAVPLLSIFGAEDQICDPEASQAAYETVPGARIAEIEGAGHSPNVEKPEETAQLIEEFAAEAATALPPGDKPRR
jgi:pimeloyl-ACP methyl ester carboxylesterase